MRTISFIILTVMSVVVLSEVVILAHSDNTKAITKKSNIEIPEAIRIEHEAIHSTLVEATKVPGRLGIAAKNLAEILHPHFVREEEIALPPLGLLRPLAAGERLSEAEVSEVLTMSDSLKLELPKMLEEHKKIHAAVETLARVAEEEKASKYQELAHQLALHAQNEEEVMYPAAILVGEIIRARQSQ
jgi:hypothetical protein